MFNQYVESLYDEYQLQVELKSFYWKKHEINFIET